MGRIWKSTIKSDFDENKIWRVSCQIIRKNEPGRRGSKATPGWGGGVHLSKSRKVINRKTIQFKRASCYWNLASQTESGRLSERK